MAPACRACSSTAMPDLPCLVDSVRVGDGEARRPSSRRVHTHLEAGQPAKRQRYVLLAGEAEEIHRDASTRAVVLERLPAASVRDGPVGAYEGGGLVLEAAWSGRGASRHFGGLPSPILGTLGEQDPFHRRGGETFVGLFNTWRGEAPGAGGGPCGRGRPSRQFCRGGAF